MSLLGETTPLLITYNEIQNIERVLAKLGWAKRIVVIDSGSTDGTLDVLKADPRIDIVHRPFVSFADQCNFGLTQIRSEWVLSMDADYELSDGFVEHLCTLAATDESGFRANFAYRIFGRPLSGTLYPPRIVLYRPGKARYENEGHGHRVRIDGRVGELKGVIYHDDRKPLSRWFNSQLKYAAIEAQHLLDSDPARMSFVDRVRRRGWFAPMLVFGYVLIVNRALFDGPPGWFYAFQRLLAELVISLEIIDRRQADSER